MSTQPIVAVHAVSKNYGARQVLKGVTFEVGEGEVFGILGPNGVGKTTLVEIIQGLRGRHSGTVRLLGRDPGSHRAELRRLVGSQLQASALPDRLRVGEALRLFARLAGDVVDWRRLRDQWDLKPLEGTHFEALSGGERQRLFIALALVNRPRVVFLDELTQGLDPAARRETWRMITRVRDQGTTVVLVSHYMDEVEALCDRVGVLFGGRITAVGSPRELVASHGGRVTTHFRGVDADTARALTVVRGVDTVEYDAHGVQVVGDDASPALVAAHLVGAGQAPRDFEIRRPSLEDVFVSLTSGHDAEGGR